MDETTDLPLPKLVQANNQENFLEIDSLSDEELDRILLKSSTLIAPPVIINDLKSQEDKKLDLNHLSSAPKKSIKDIVKTELSKIQSKELNANRRKMPAKDIEQIAEKEAEKRSSFVGRAISQHRWKIDKESEIILSKQSTNEPLLKSERKNMLIKNHLDRIDIENEICKKRTILKDLTQIILDKKECECIDEFSYIGETGVIVSACKKCSRSKEWKNVNEWYRYIKQSKKEQQNDE